MYESDEEEGKRKAIFKENLDKITAHNKLYEQGAKHYKLGVNEYSDRVITNIILEIN